MEFKQRKTKIIILSGKAKSGKNTVADILQSLNKDQKIMQTSYSYYLKDYARRILDWDGKEETKPRAFLQELGISLIQKNIDSQLLIRRLCEDICVFSYFYDMILVTDARLKAEIEIPKQQFSDVTVIRITRDDYKDGLTEIERKHVTETELDTYTDYDYIIKNSGDEVALRRAVEAIWEEIK